MEAVTVRGWSLVEKKRFEENFSFFFPISTTASHSHDMEPTHVLLFRVSFIISFTIYPHSVCISTSCVSLLHVSFISTFRIYLNSVYVPTPRLYPHFLCVSSFLICISTLNVCPYSPYVSPLSLSIYIPTSPIFPFRISFILSFCVYFHSVYISISYVFLLRVSFISLFHIYPNSVYDLTPYLCPYFLCMSSFPICVSIPNLYLYSPCVSPLSVSSYSLCISSLYICILTPYVSSLFVSYVFLLTICLPTYQASYQFFIYYLIYNKQPVIFIKTAQVIIHVQFIRPKAVFSYLNFSSRPNIFLFLLFCL